jgi:NAD(P)H dehydrogenase (quinone)
MKVLLVYAHPEPRSFNGAMKDLAVTTLLQQGHQVVVSDLYAMAFWAGAGRADFLAQDDEPLNMQNSQLAAATHAGFAPEVSIEIEKLRACEMLILQFPVWWFSMPGILKGWIDRVFAYGFAYGPAASLSGRKAMVVATTGGPADSYTAATRGTVDDYLKHLLVGSLAFCDMEVLPTFVGYGVARLDVAARQAVLDSYVQHLKDCVPTKASASAH